MNTDSSAHAVVRSEFPRLLEEARKNRYHLLRQIFQRRQRYYEEGQSLWQSEM
jgi:hypothetical protein